MTDGLLLVHAFPVDAGMWEGQVAAFSDRLSVVAVNLPGFGGTPPAGDVMTMAAAADRCVQELDREGIDRAVACGLSMGGYVVFELWRSHGDRVAGLVLANTRAEPDDDAGRERRRALAERLRAEGSAFLVRTPPPLLSEGASEQLWGTVRAMIAAQPPEAIAAASLGMAERPDSRPDLASISVPTLVVTSTADTLIPAEATAPIADAVPEAELETIEGVGHLSNLEAPDEFNAALAGHLHRSGLA